MADAGFGEALRAAADVDAPDWAIGAGVIRDVVWDHLHGFEEKTQHRDVDLAFFDPADLSPERDRAVTEALVARLAGVPWQAKNQAAVHRWYEGRFGYPVEPLVSIADAVGTWPETAVCVAVRLRSIGGLEVIAPYGLTDLLDGIWRWNPRRVPRSRSDQRFREKRIADRWPLVSRVD